MTDNYYDLRLNRILANYYQQQRDLVATQDCPSAEDLLDYAEDTLAVERVDPIHEHLPFCQECQDVVWSFRPVLQDSEEEGVSSHLLGRWRAWSFSGWLPATAVGMATLIIAVTGLQLYPSKLSVLSYVGRAESASRLRSIEREADPLAATYQRGVASLVDAQTWILKRVDERKVDESIRYLTEAKKLAEGANNQTYAGECAFYLGKAYLKKGDVAQARRAFEEVLKLGEPTETLLLTKEQAAQHLRALGR